MNEAPLTGVRVADFTWVWAGPYTSMLLALLGAEVIKIESSKRMDTARRGAYSTGQRFNDPNVSAVFNTLNLNKLSVTLNLSAAKGVDLAKRIVAMSDVVVQNMRPGAMDRLGLGYEHLRKIKPDIIMLSSSALGSTGPERTYIGYANNFASFSGASYLAGEEGDPPSELSGSIDLRSGTAACFAILCALHYRARTGRGQHIDLSSPEAISVLVGDLLMDYTMNCRVAERTGNRDRVMAPHNCYRCKGDGAWVSIAVGSDQEWQAFGSPEWTHDPRCADAFRRWKHHDELDRLVGAWCAQRTPEEVVEALAPAGVAVAPTASSEMLFKDPHIRERGLYDEVQHPAMNKQVVIGAPWKLASTPEPVRRHAPLMGEHNHYVLGELLGLTEEEMRALQEEQVLV
jgi:benzylsuccinate CoA-transferase BbsF subunit